MKCSKMLFLLLGLCSIAMQSVAQEELPIQHDDEHYVLLAQNENNWALDDKAVDRKLAEIRANNGGSAPNIIYILLDDVGFGELGSKRLNYYNGYKTPNINRLADEGASFLRMYSESVCTPTRVAFSTGRYPVRTGIGAAKVSLTGGGLSADEVTIAEVLSEAGYNTVHIGKWHLGDIEQAWPHKQGFDYAEFPIHQQAQLALMTRDAEDANVVAGQAWKSRGNDFVLDKDFRFNPAHMVVGVEAKKGGEATEVGIKAGENWTQAKYREMNLRYQASVMKQLDQLAPKDEPFFLNYWPLYPLTFVRSGIDEFESRNGGTMAESMQEVDAWIGDIVDKVDELGIAENTLIVVMGDNGPFLAYMGVTGQAERLHRGGKGDHLEGGIHVDAFARWKGVIDAGSFIGDMIYVGDLYTTFARIGGATDYIPRDRIVDGVDQTPSLLLGEQHGRRDYLFVYEGPVLKSVIKEHYKLHLAPPGKNPLLSEFFNLLQDPREEKGHIKSESFKSAIWSFPTFGNMMKGHMLAQKQYPNRPQVHAEPYTGIVNLRPETLVLKKDFMENTKRQMSYLKSMQ
ncbi:MAG: sulfatase-like hydrolase/transferase [Pseudomonadales bacterium]